MLCQPSMPTARARITAFNSSWPMPAAAAAISAANRATMPAPTTPPARPTDIHKPRRGAPVLAASTMPTISAASNTSRKTMMAAPSIVDRPLSRNNVAACGLRVEIPEELVFARFQRADINGDLVATGHHFFTTQLGALKFLRCRIVVLDDQRDLLAGWDLNFSRMELVVLDLERIAGILGGEAGCHGRNESEREECETNHPRNFPGGWPERSDCD